MRSTAATKTFLLVGIVAAGAAPAAALELTVDFEHFPGRDGLLGTADDVPAPVCPEFICSGRLDDEYAAVGLRFASGELAQGLFFPDAGASNHFISSSPPDATLSLPVYGLAIDSFSVWTAVLYALDERGRVIASDVLPHPSPGSTFFAGTLRLTTHRPIHRFTVLAEGCEIGGRCDPILNLDNLVLTLVREAAGGSLRFSQPVYRAREGDPEALLTVERTHGFQGAVSATVFVEDGSALSGLDYVRQQETLVWEDGDARPRTVTVPLVDDADPELSETVAVRLAEPVGGAGVGAPGAATLVIADDDQPPGAACVDGEHTLCLGAEGRFRVRVFWRLADGRRGTARVTPVFDGETGLVTFARSEGVRMFVKVLDGCPVNGRFWVFYAATTDASFAVTVTDTATGRTARYSNALGRVARPVLDTEALAVCF